jgi:hypothetical protein
LNATNGMSKPIAIRKTGEFNTKKTVLMRWR